MIEPKEIWIELIQRINADPRLKLTHIALLFAIISLGMDRKEARVISVSRRVLMTRSRIKSTSTYHSSLKDLVTFQYFTYLPSFDPRQKTLISFL